MDAHNQEIKYIKSKFKDKADSIDAEARVVFRTGLKTRIIKCIGEYNYYSTRNRIINRNGIMN